MRDKREILLVPETIPQVIGRSQIEVIVDHQPHDLQLLLKPDLGVSLALEMWLWPPGGPQKQHDFSFYCRFCDSEWPKNRLFMI